MRFRKCKHVLVSLDEMDQQLTQDEYRQQATTFLNHLVKLLNDVTFPIWMFTLLEPPQHTANCRNPKMPRTSDHPCNDVLLDLFRPDQKQFPEQVHLLDNTDLTLPRFDECNHVDVLTVIALRAYVFVGKQVAAWRKVGQKGLVDGLHRNGTVEPNFELVPYTAWS